MDGPLEIANFRTKLEAEIAAGVLENAGIPCVIQSTEGILHGPISPGASIFVARSAAPQALAALGEPQADAPPEDAA